MSAETAVGGGQIAARAAIHPGWVRATRLVYVALGIVSGRFRRKLLPISPAQVLADAKAALSFKLSHEDISRYNAVQKLLYVGVILAGIVIVLSGLAIWKPVQLQELTALFGGYDEIGRAHVWTPVTS